MAEYYFTDKNRDYRICKTINDDDGNNYSKIFFHKVKWNAHNRPDIKELDAIWAEDIMQSIIDGNSQGDFEIKIVSENGEEEYTWFDWEIMNAWDSWS